MLNWGDNWPDYPRTAIEVMNEISDRIGSPLDKSVELQPYTISYAKEMTMREVAGYIAALHGGNWIVTDSGTLALISLAKNVRLLGTDENHVLTFGGVILLA